MNQTEPNIYLLHWQEQEQEEERKLINLSKTFTPSSPQSQAHHHKMQTSLTILPSNTPSIFPFHQPINPHPHRLSAPHNPSLHTHHQHHSHASPISSLRDSGGLYSVLGREEEYRKARSQVLRKELDLEGFTIEGISVGGHETCIMVPQFKCAFDIGRNPARAFQQNFLCITHAHLDHIGGLPMYVATRGLYSMQPPTIFVPPSIKEDVEKLFDIYRSMGQVELNFELVALDIGETYELRNDLVVRPFTTYHVIPSQGYLVYSIRRKLKKQYTHLKGKEIEKLKKSDVEITDLVLYPELAFTGDTTSEFMVDPRNADALRAKVLITEATFLDDCVSVEHAREHGHTHLLEIIENAHWIRNKTVVLTHFSSRYHIEDIHLAASKLQSKLKAKVVTLTEGFKSMHT